ncbi:MAG: TlpA family protein disulfide reductase [Pseudomonadota bacterium]|nr:TlpA family protein disulfide reductase [Pseudomonadota bacterium]
MFARSLVVATALSLAFLAPLARADYAPLPESVRGLVKALALEKFKDISYRDAAGKAITAEEFDVLVKAGNPVSATKTNKVAVLSITTKEAIKAAAPPPPRIKPGDHFPAFQLAKLDGAKFDNASLRGRYSLINFYFAQCGPCIKEVPEPNALAKSRGDLNFVGVTFDTADETRQFAADTKFNWTLLPSSIKLINELGVRGYPTFALLDPNGALVAISVHDAIIEKDKSIAAWVERVVPRAR